MIIADENMEVRHGHGLLLAEIEDDPYIFSH
jgi:hypothetical protein